MTEVTVSAKIFKFEIQIEFKFKLCLLHSLLQLLFTVNQFITIYFIYYI